MSRQNLLLIRCGDSLDGFVVGEAIANMVRNEDEIHVLGKKFLNHGSCCEWLEARDAQTDRAVGLSFVDFYPSLLRPTTMGLKANNVLWNINEEATWLFINSQSWANGPGPYLPVQLLIGSGDVQGYFVYQGLPCASDCDLNLPTIKNDVRS